MIVKTEVTHLYRGYSSENFEGRVVYTLEDGSTFTLTAEGEEI